MKWPPRSPDLALYDSLCRAMLKGIFIRIISQRILQFYERGSMKSTPLEMLAVTRRNVYKRKNIWTHVIVIFCFIFCNFWNIILVYYCRMAFYCIKISLFTVLGTKIASKEKQNETHEVSYVRLRKNGGL